MVPCARRTECRWAGITLRRRPRPVRDVGELPDLWDVNVAILAGRCRLARFARRLAGRLASLRQTMTSKPVVTWAAYTHPTGWRRIINGGVLDYDRRRTALHRRSLPAKEDRGRPLEDIRECIGCNMSAHSPTARGPIALHPEPDHERGMAARLASREHRPTRDPMTAVLDRGSRPCRTGSRPGPGPARLRTSCPGRGRTDELGGRARSRKPGCPAFLTWAPGASDWRIGQLPQAAQCLRSSWIAN